jgi:hypothetical protein
LQVVSEDSHGFFLSCVLRVCELSPDGARSLVDGFTRTREWHHTAPSPRLGAQRVTKRGDHSVVTGRFVLLPMCLGAHYRPQPASPVAPCLPDMTAVRSPRRQLKSGSTSRCLHCRSGFLGRKQRKSLYGKGPAR